MTDDVARPGIAPGARRRSAGTMVAELYGELAPHPGAEPDAYGLFLTRSLAMGWLDDTSAGGGAEDRTTRAPGLWCVNDAGWTHPDAGPGLVAWFQVDVTAPAGDRPLPVQPFLSCAHDAVARAGTADVTAVRLELPVGGIDPRTRPPYAPVPALHTAGWFDTAAAWTAVELDAGPASLEGLHVYRDGRLAEWSAEAIGWLGEVLADRAAWAGVRAPLRLAVRRVGGGSPDPA
ncbi:hypothetical protein ACQP1P_26035 [Dactylosporangium sp. CA-052675]|uniref:hypothetical protein n=1 Tax=Dactylosporangium sp. CA-052675 TaxID=3239927 RepID=UPI003D8FCDC2